MSQPTLTLTPPPVQTTAPPPPPPPPHDQPDKAVPGPVHPELDVSAHVPFKFDNMVVRSIADNIKGYFTEAHPNWTNTPEHIKKTWFKYFADKWRVLEDATKLIFLSTVFWDGLKAYWKDGHNANDDEADDSYIRQDTVCWPYV
ncbi:unnamed protein product [Cochlearia groenlandica]